MPSFSRDDRFSHPADFLMLQNGGVQMCCAQEEIDRQVQALESIGYSVRRVDLSSADFHGEVARVLAFPDYYGRTLDALRDCLTDIAVPGRGLVIVLERAHKANPKLVENCAAVFEDASRFHLLFGERLIVLIHSNDPQLQLEIRLSTQLTRRSTANR